MGQARIEVWALASVALVIGLVQGAGAFAATDSIRPAPRPGSVVPVTGAPVANSEAAPAAVPQIPALAARSPIPRPAALLDGHEFRLALVSARKEDWDDARRLASLEGPVAVDIIEWQRLRAGQGSFEDYQAFLSRNADWPGLKLLRRRGEATIQDRPNADRVLEYFKPQAPQTGQGALRLAEAHAVKGDFQRSRKALIEAWRGLPMSAEEEAKFLAQHGQALKPYHADRLEDALWRKDRDAARRVLKFARGDQKALAEARLALQARSGNADKLWKDLPAAVSGDPGLARDRMEWLVAKKQRSQAADLIIAQSKSAAKLGRPEAWARWRRILARQEMRNGNPRRAYALASQSHIAKGSDLADLEWLAGYIALRYRDDPEAALEHFTRFRAQVFTPISLGRAGYWEGRAYEAQGRAEAAREAFGKAAKHQTSFYGLLAAEKIGAAMDPALTGATDGKPLAETAFAKSSVFAAAQIFFKSGEPYEVTRFLRHLSESTAQDELVALGSFAASLGDPYIAVRVAKQIAREGMVANRAYYPLTNLGPDSLPVEKALALAIARRESEFWPTAVSGAGARGLMQLMPGTAEQMAGKLGLPYQFDRLTTDPTYNVRLASAYLAQLTERYGNNIVLISVGYNAGPARATRWMETNGDPRRSSVDVVDWIEHIPFDETRNYVMRVAESLPVYRARLTGKVQPIRLMEELQAR
ncbi:Soluble lytic murein transglycosylase precursor [Candidatus Rhodobacter oscarellae]|uniref:Soluble lytic murein transglycosylase n=1 Tax=Candidatus Rhodobacter oscarellae TaxID=1675527 RepID=A0A0J9ED42_9RHOB|nr:lytic transglycosylase domain-containing protein [Candidatus Rhodobacter lobularis]KMW59639.1 Soluble lytic murein transglycosylase precursor [Candidatus Rhodobacter lobularis]